MEIDYELTYTLHMSIKYYLQISTYKHSCETCKIRGFHGSDYEEWCLLGCYAVWLL
jgi:hypothetical protein